MKTWLIRLLAAVGFCFAASAQALTLDPADTSCTTEDNSNLNGASVLAIANECFFNPDLAGPLTLYYKANVGNTQNPGTTEEGSFAGSYTTTFSNSALDPEDALIDYISGSSISCGVCILVVKDGNSDPAQYIFNLSNFGAGALSWNGTDDINLQDFWAGSGDLGKGAISNVAIWGIPATSTGGGTSNGGTSNGGSTSGDVSEPATSALAIFGLGLLGLALRSRRRAR